MRRVLIFALLIILAGCTGRSNLSEYQASPVQKTIVLFIKIPDAVMPIERREKYDVPLNEFLATRLLGKVTAGGSQFSQPNATGQRSIEWVCMDVEIYDREKALPLIIQKLKELGAPEGTEIEQYEPIERTIKVK